MKFFDVVFPAISVAISSTSTASSDFRVPAVSSFAIVVDQAVVPLAGVIVELSPSTLITREASAFES